MEKSGTVIKEIRRVKSTLIILLSLFVLLFVSSACKYLKKNSMEKRASVKGILINKQGLPVADAVVMIKDGSHEFNDIASVSNELGEFFVSDIVIPGKYVLQIEQDSGSFLKEINVQSADSVISINLTP